MVMTKEERKQYMKEYREKNKKNNKKYMKDYYQKNKQKARKYNQTPKRKMNVKIKMGTWTSRCHFFFILNPCLVRSSKK